MSSSNALNWELDHESDSDVVEIEAEFDLHSHDEHESQHNEGNGEAEDVVEDDDNDEESQEYPSATLTYDQDQQDVVLEEILPQRVEETSESEHEPSSLSISMGSSVVSATSGDSSFSGHIALSNSSFGIRLSNNILSGRSDSSADQSLSDVDVFGDHLFDDSRKADD
jgi:hypothetical protein